MTLKEHQRLASLAQPVEKDKFDRHMRRARENDKGSRQKQFIQQSEESSRKKERIGDIMPSVY